MLPSAPDRPLRDLERKRKSVAFTDKVNTEKRRKDKKRSKEVVYHNSTTQKSDIFIRKIHDRPINERYILLRKLGEGGFGAVYLGRNIIDGKEVALKLEHRSRDPSTLEEEAQRCIEFRGLEGFADVEWYGLHDDYKVMAFELLGPSLEDLFAFCNYRFSLKTVLMIMNQLLHRLEALHLKGILHRDIKPSNCLMGSASNGNVVYLTDFGLAQEARASENATATGITRPRLVGTARFASIAGHEGREQSFKDDLESLGYMVMYLLQGRLPWQGLEGHRNEKEALVMEKKKGTSVDELCAELPVEFAEYSRQTSQLQHGELPNYSRLRKLFRQLAEEQGVEYDNVFDWTVLLFLQQNSD